MLIRQPIGCWGGESEADYPNKKDLEEAGQELNRLHQKYRDLKRMRDMERATRTLELRIQLKVLNSEIDLTYAPSLAEIV